MNATRAKLMRAMEAYFKEDTKRINHTHRITEYAEELLKQERGGDYSIVIGASSAEGSDNLYLNVGAISAEAWNLFLTTFLSPTHSMSLGT